MNGNTGWKRYESAFRGYLYCPHGANLQMASRYGWTLTIHTRTWREVKAGKMRFAVQYGGKILFRTNSLRRAKRFILEYKPNDN